MSGRPKGPVPTAADELRQLTREANEATRDLRAVLRELKAARDGLGTSIDELMADRVNANIEILNKHVRDAEEEMIASTDKLRKMVGQHHAALMWVTTPEELIKLLTRTFMEDLHDPEVFQAIAGHVANHLEAEIVVGSAKGRCKL